MYSTKKFNLYMYSGCIRWWRLPFYIRTSDCLKELLNWPVIDRYKWNKDNGCRLWYKSNLAISYYPEDGGNIIPTKDGTQTQTARCHKMEQQNMELKCCEILNVTNYLKPEYNKFLSCQTIHKNSRLKRVCSFCAYLSTLPWKCMG
jgi:hypothetical protein